MDTMERINEFLASSETELATLEKKAEEIIKKRDQLRSVVNGLRKMLDGASKAGLTSAHIDEYRQSKTDAIVDIVKAANGEFLSAKEIEQRLQERGFPTRHNSIVTILSRLAKKGILKNVPRHGYTCKEY